MTVVYTAVEPFDPGCGERWREYIAWSGLTQLREVVSLDGLLCPTVIEELTDEDWQHNVQADFKLTLFHDLDYLLRRVGENRRVNILALQENPTVDEVRSFGDRGFVFRGFDLVELQSGNSALLNCGGFDKAFSPADLSECGLLTDQAQALGVQKRLREEYPDEAHADCDLWAVWLLKG
jgi:hypothetical protein